MRDRLPGAPAVRGSDCEPIACSACGSIWRIEVVGLKFVRHPVIVHQVGESRQTWWICCGCKKQVTKLGDPVVPEAGPGELIPEEIAKEIGHAQ